MNDPDDNALDDPEPFESAGNHNRTTKAHTQHFDRAAFYNASPGHGLESRGQAFLRSFKGRVMIQFLYVVNFLFAVTAMAIVVVAIMVGQAHKKQLIGAVSDDFAFAILGFGLALFGFALLGCSAARTSNRCLLVLYVAAILILILGLVVLMITQAIVTDSERAQEVMRHVWEKAVAEAPQKVCDLQHDLQCSGFVSNCTDADPARLDCAKCVPESDGEFAQACWSLLQRDIQKNLKPLTYVSLGTLAIMVLAFISACGICRHIRVKDRERVLYQRLGE